MSVPKERSNVALNLMSFEGGEQESFFF